MTLGHFLYIPGVLCLGILIGYILGGRAVEVARADREADARRQAARRARRDAEAGAPGTPPADNPPAP
jgi:hypothetical protein